MDNDRKLRSEFRTALDEVLPPTPWLEATIVEELRKRRRGGSTDGTGTRPQRGRLLFANPVLQLATVAILLLVALVVGLLVTGALRQSQPSPAGIPTLHVYWANSGEGSGTTVGRAGGDGTAINQTFLSGAKAPWDVAVDQLHIYWVNNASGTIGRAMLDGTDLNQSFITGAQSPLGVVVDGSYIYWSNAGANCHGPLSTCDGTTIGRAKLDGSSVNQSFITGADGPAHLAVNGNYIYWANFNGSTIGRASLDGSGANQRFLTTAGQPGGVAVDGSYIYWRTPTGIGRANLNGTNVTHNFITAAVGAGGIAVDSTHIYWCNRDASADIVDWFRGTTIGRANLDGTGVNQKFIAGADGPTGIAVGQF